MGFGAACIIAPECIGEGFGDAFIMEDPACEDDMWEDDIWEDDIWDAGVGEGCAVPIESAMAALPSATVNAMVKAAIEVFTFLSFARWLSERTRGNRGRINSDADSSVPRSRGVLPGRAKWRFHSALQLRLPQASMRKRVERSIA